MPAVAVPPCPSSRAGHGTLQALGALACDELTIRLGISHSEGGARVVEPRSVDHLLGGIDADGVRSGAHAHAAAEVEHAARALELRMHLPADVSAPVAGRVDDERRQGSHERVQPAEEPRVAKVMDLGLLPVKVRGRMSRAAAKCRNAAINVDRQLAGLGSFGRGRDGCLHRGRRASLRLHRTLWRQKRACRPKDHPEQQSGGAARHPSTKGSNRSVPALFVAPLRSFGRAVRDAGIHVPT